MGCDIHCYMEVKQGDKWVSITREYTDSSGEQYLPRVYSSRHYDLFSALAGVRGKHDPIAPPRGLPDDISEEVKLEWERWKEDGHSASWYTKEELKEVAFNNRKDPRSDLIFDFVYGLPDSYGVDARVVFWFDN